MRKQSGVWEIRKWQGITYNNGEITKDTIINDMGYIALWNNNLNGLNDVHYNLTYTPYSWQTISNNDTGLDKYDDYCWWESDTYKNDRFALLTLGRFNEYIVMMFTVNKLSKNNQEWTFITTGVDSASSMSAKEIFTMERVKTP